MRHCSNLGGATVANEKVVGIKSRQARPAPPRARTSHRRSQRALLPQLPSLTGPVVVISLLAFAGMGLFKSEPEPVVQLSTGTAITASFSICGSIRHTCIVAGDTIWLNGQNLRLRSYDTPFGFSFPPSSKLCSDGRAAVAPCTIAAVRSPLRSGHLSEESEA